MATKTLTPEEFVDALETWTVLDVVNAVKLMEDKLGIKAAAPVAAAAAPGRGSRRPGRGADRVHGHPHPPRRRQDQRHQGGPRDHRARPQGGQGPGRRRPEGDPRRPSRGRRPTAAKAKLEEAGATVEIK